MRWYNQGVMPRFPRLFAFLLLAAFAGAQPKEGNIRHTLHLAPGDARSSDLSVPHTYWRTLTEVLKWAKDLWDAEDTTRLVIHTGVYNTPIHLDNHRSPASFIIEAAPGATPVFDVAGATNRAFLFAVRTHNLVLRGITFSNVTAETKALFFRRGRNLLIERCPGLTPASIRLELCDGVTFRHNGFEGGGAFLDPSLSNRNIHVDETNAPRPAP